MKYRLKKRPSDTQMKEVMQLFHGAVGIKGIIDMTKKHLEEKQDVLLDAM